MRDLIATATADTDRAVAALYDLMDFYVLILAYALVALAVSVLAQWYLRTAPTTTTASAYTDAERHAIARLHLRYRSRH